MYGFLKNKNFLSLTRISTPTTLQAKISKQAWSSESRSHVKSGALANMIYSKTSILFNYLLFRQPKLRREIIYDASKGVHSPACNKHVDAAI